MKGWVWFKDGHREDIVNGIEFDDPGHPNELHYIMVETQSGCYRKTIRKKTKTSDCYGFQPMLGYTHPVNILGYNGVVDIVVDRDVTYKYTVDGKDGHTITGEITVKDNASFDDIYWAIFDSFSGVEIERVEGRG